MVVKRSTKPGKSETAKNAAASPELVGENIAIVRNYTTDGALNDDATEVVETLLFPERARVGKISLQIGGGTDFGKTKGSAMIIIPALLEEIEDGTALAYAKEKVLALFGELAEIIGTEDGTAEEEEAPKGKSSKKSSKKAPKEEEEEEEEDDDDDGDDEDDDDGDDEDGDDGDDEDGDLTEDDIRKMSRKELETFIEEWVEENGAIETDPSEFKKGKKGDAELAEAVIAELFADEDGEAYTEEDLSDMEEDDLKEICKELGLDIPKSKKASVRKAEMIAAILEAQEEGDDD